MTNLLTAVDMLATKCASTVDHATYKYITETISWLREAGERPEDYELVMTQQSHIIDSMTVEWSLSIRKIKTPGIVD